MISKETGGPAFPRSERDDGVPTTHYFGMTLRDYFAVHATDEDITAQAEIIRSKLVHSGAIGILPDDWRTTARYMHADEMLKARTAQ